MSKNTIIKGTLILTLAGILTKILGFYNRIFLTRLIGVKELGVYQLVFPVYLLAYSLCCQGISTTLTKHISHYMGKKNYARSVRVFFLCLLMSLSISIIISIIISRASYPISLYILKNTDCAILLKIIAIAIPFVSVKGCINAYFVAVNRPGYHGFSHLIEQVIRITTAYVLADILNEEYINSVLAVLAVVTGELSATLISVLFYKIYTGKLTNNYRRENNTATGEVFKSLMSDILPITANSVIFMLFSSFEAVLMPTMLYQFYSDSEAAMEMYGIITGIVIPFLLFPSTITTSLSTMLLPAVSFANAKNDCKRLKGAVSGSIIFCVILGISAWFFFVILGKPVCTFAFQNKEAGILLRNMSFLCPLIYLSGTLSAIMNGMDKALNNTIFNISGISIRIIVCIMLVPKYGVPAYIAGMTISYAVIDLMLLVTCVKGASLSPSPSSHKVCSDIHNN